MMWLVRLALSRPYTFIVASILILILSVVAVVRTPTDIFPNINIPVVGVVWGYTGLRREKQSIQVLPRRPLSPPYAHTSQRLVSLGAICSLVGNS